MVKMQAKESVTIDDGKHKGKILRVEYRTDPYQYTDFIISVEGSDIELKCGVPSRIAVDKEGSATTGLARILMNLGIKVEADAEYDPDTTIGKEVEYLTVTDKTERGSFARIVVESLKAVKVKA